MFCELAPAVHNKTDLLKLAMELTADPGVDDTDPTLPKAAPETAEHIEDDDENTGILSGYTYLKQFIDHDITFNPASMLMQQKRSRQSGRLRTARLDLESVCGRGPADQPYRYIGNKFRLGAQRSVQIG
ncbi:hypothetical protein [Rhizobium mesoamericanum]|uniref:hypothetical protein n=1 Tax=Rhizobium mesoamericanum TaxID=1079800 RepID=UPI00041ABB89|nr:hypothetical protein [Rhizobium mesoamericanum]